MNVDRRKPSYLDMNVRLRSSRIKAGFQSASDAIRRFGWPASQYRAHENGQNPFRVQDAEKYGEAFGVPAGWLLTGQGPDAVNPVYSRILRVGKASNSINNDNQSIKLLGAVCVGLWRDAVLLNDTAEKDPGRIAPIDPRYPNDAQFDMQVQGSALSKIASEGSFIRCLDLRVIQHEIKDGDFVVVERSNESGLQEISAKLLRVNGSRTELHNATDEPHLKDQIIVIEEESKKGKIQIIGKILWAYKKLDE